MTGTRTPTLFSRATTKPVDPNRAIRIQRSADYPNQIWYFLACFIALLALFHIGALVVRWQRKRVARRSPSKIDAEKYAINGEPTRSSANGRISLRRIPVAIINSFRILACRFTIPIGGGNVLNFAEIGITFGYIIALFTWEFINCMNVKTGVKLDVSYWGNRAGNIVAVQMPLVVALAGKNNIISLLTGISYEKLNVLHRVSARICLILVWVHFMGRIKSGISSETLSSPWLRAGIMVAVAYTILVFISFRPLRSKFYEFFFFSHCVLVLMILIGVYWHIRLAQGFGPYLIPSFVLWALDRFIRAVRVLWNNRTSILTSRTSSSPDATAELLSPNMVRIVLRRNMTWRPGQNAFITMPGISNIPFEAHPFTIASIPRGGSSLDAGSAESSVEEVGKAPEKNEENELVFLVGVREGTTRLLREEAERQGGEGTIFPLSVYVDGPYGSPPDMNAFKSVVLIAGGSGVSYALPLLQDVVSNARQGKTACCSVSFIWAIRHRAHLSWISRDLNEALEAAPESLQIRVRIHITRSAYSESATSLGDSPVETKEYTDAAMDQLLGKDGMRVDAGRPTVHALLEDELANATGPVSVGVAGPAGLAAEVRKALRSGLAGPKAVLKGGPDVTLNVETYGIA